MSPAVAAVALNIVFSSSSVNWDGSHKYNNPRVKMDDGHEYFLTPESAKSACERLGFQYLVDQGWWDALWGTFDAIHLQSQDWAGPMSSRRKLTHVTCAVDELAIGRSFQNGLGLEDVFVR